MILRDNVKSEIWFSLHFCKIYFNWEIFSEEIIVYVKMIGYTSLWYLQFLFSNFQFVEKFSIGTKVNSRFISLFNNNEFNRENITANYFCNGQMERQSERKHRPELSILDKYRFLTKTQKVPKFFCPPFSTEMLPWFHFHSHLYGSLPWNIVFCLTYHGVIQFWLMTFAHWVCSKSRKDVIVNRL